MAEALATLHTTEPEQTYPWLLFKLGGRSYALTSEVVIGISTLPEQLVSVPHVPNWMRGLFNMRGEAIALVDMRTLFNQPTMAQERQVFSDMLEARKQDHLRWVKELERSVEEDVPFTLATDPHQCAFGKWYDNYVSPSGAINFHLAKINEPHQKLHQCAVQVMECKRDCANCNRDTCLKEALHQAANNYCPTVARLIDEAKEMFQQGSQEMIIVLERDNTRFGIIIDEVLSVEEITGQNTDTENFHHTQYVNAVCRSSSTGAVMLMLSLDSLFGVVEGVRGMLY